MAKRATLSEALAVKPGKAAEPVAAPEAEPAAPARPKDDRVGMTLRLSPEAWKQLRMLALDLRRPAHDIAIEGLNLAFKLHGKPEIAEVGKDRARSK